MCPGREEGGGKGGGGGGRKEQREKGHRKGLDRQEEVDQLKEGKQMTRRGRGGDRHRRAEEGPGVK